MELLVLFDMRVLDSLIGNIVMISLLNWWQLVLIPVLIL